MLIYSIGDTDVRRRTGELTGWVEPTRCRRPEEEGGESGTGRKNSERELRVDETQRWVLRAPSA